MPDESAASSEHALLQEITAPLANLPANPVPPVADVEFPIALRGYDRMAVDAYVRQTSQLVAELQATRSPENAVRRALERVGEEVSDILKRAHDTASQITAQSRSDAEDRLEAARQEAADATAGAEQRLRELDSETDRIWAERHRIVEDARTLAEQLLVLAESAVERFPADEEPGADQVPDGVVSPGTDEAPGADSEGAPTELFDGERDVDAAGTEPAAEAAGTEPAAEAPAVEYPDDDHEAPKPGDVEATRVMPTFKRDDERSA